MSDAKTYLADLIEPPRAGFWGAGEWSAIAPVPCRVVRNGDVAKNGYIERNKLPVRWFGAGELDKAEVSEHDIVLVSSGAYTGNAGKVIGLPDDYRVIASNFVRRLRPKRDVVADWVFHLVRSDVVQVCVPAHTSGSAIPNLSSSLYRKCSVHPPPNRDGQQFIADVLNKIDEVIEQTEALIAKQQQVKAGLMHDLFTRGLTPDGQLRPTRAAAPNLYHETPFGWLPKEWSVESLGALAEIVSGVTLSAKTEFGAGIQVPYLRVANVQDGYLDLSEIKTVRVSSVQLEKLSLRAGDVLMNEGGDFDKLGRGTVWNEEISPCIHQNHVFRVRPRSDRLRSRYLAFWSQSTHGKKYFVLNSKQSTNLASINSTQLHRFPVALPGVDEQREIETRILAQTDIIAAETAHLAKLRQLKQGLMQALLAPPG